MDISQSRQAWARLWCIAAALLAGLLYLNALHNPFVYDDVRTVVDNGSIVSLLDIGAIARYDSTRPLTNASFALDRAIWGAAPFGFHVTNVLLHVLNVVLVFALASALWTDRLRQCWTDARDASGAVVATLAAGLFGVHPVMTEAVGYISGRADLLCATLFLLGILGARRWLARGGSGLLLLVWLLWAGALLAKETAGVLPLVVLAYGWLFVPPSRLGQPARPRVVTLAAPLLVVMLLAAGARLAVFLLLERGAFSPGATAVQTTLGAFWQYAMLALVPAGQTIFHGTAGSVSAVRAWAEGAALLGSMGLTWALRRRAPVLTFGWWWFVLVLAPSALLAGTSPEATVAEHRAYLPAAGVFIAAAAAAGALLPVVSRFRSTRVLAPLACLAIVLMLGGRTFVRNLVWSDPVTLWEEAAVLNPGHWLPRAVLGESLHAQGRHEEAVAAYRESLRRRPDNAGTAINLSVCLAELGREDDAMAVMDQLEGLHPLSPYVAVGRGAVAAIGGRFDAARPQLQLALSRDPSNIMARQWLAVLAEQASDPGEALNQCYQLQRQIPGRLSVDRCIEQNQPAR